MKNWTVSRRIITGFVVLLFITVALGGFSLIRATGLKQNIFDLGKNTMPSLELQAEIMAAVQEKMIAIQQLNDTISTERRAELTKRLNASIQKASDLLKKYEPLLSDAQDKSFWNEATKQNEALTASINKTQELLARNMTSTAETASELSKYLQGTLDPLYDATLKAVKADLDYNVELGNAAANKGESNAASAIFLISIALGIAVVVALVVAWKVTSTTNKALQDIASNLDRGALQTAAAARQVSMASQTLSSGSSEQASSVEETSTSLEEMSSMIRATAENAQKAKSLASEARGVAQAGSKTMVEMTQAMAAIDSSSAEVAKIVKNIDEIAFQTNILALNAAVEAARAGEAGAGFAVVADEVRSLAQRSAAAAKETADKIEAAIANSRKGSQSTAKVEEALTQIAEKVSATDTLVADIATAAREQAQGIEQINNAIAQMDKVTQSNAASAEESASAAEELDAQSETLKDLVGQLRLLVGGAGVGGPSTHQSTNHQSAVVSSSNHPRGHARAKAGVSSSNNGRKSIPMPEDGVMAAGKEDGNFRNF